MSDFSKENSGDKCKVPEYTNNSTMRNGNEKGKSSIVTSIVVKLLLWYVLEVDIKPHKCSQALMVCARLLR